MGINFKKLVGKALEAGGKKLLEVAAKKLKDKDKKK